MATYDTTNIWDGETAQLFEGAGNGTDLGLFSDVSIIQERSFIDVKASQTGEQILDRRQTGMHYKVVIGFREIEQANWFKNWWFDGHPDAAGIIKLHKGTTGHSLPTKRLRLHPSNATDNTNDFLFEQLTYNTAPTMTLNGKADHVHKIELITLPDPSQLPTIDLGEHNYVEV